MIISLCNYFKVPKCLVIFCCFVLITVTLETTEFTTTPIYNETLTKNINILKRTVPHEVERFGCTIDHLDPDNEDPLSLDLQLDSSKNESWRLGFITSRGFPKEHPSSKPCVVKFHDHAVVFFQEFYLEHQRKVRFKVSQMSEEWSSALLLSIYLVLIFIL